VWVTSNAGQRATSLGCIAQYIQRGMEPRRYAHAKRTRTDTDDDEIIAMPLEHGVISLGIPKRACLARAPHRIRLGKLAPLQLVALFHIPTSRSAQLTKKSAIAWADQQ
jgi:hypothetical protein